MEDHNQLKQGSDLKLPRAEIAQRAVKALTIVIVLDVFKNGLEGGMSIGHAYVMNALDFKRMQETLCSDTVLTVAFLARRADKVMRGKQE